MKKDMERELLNWRKREFRLRKKYWDTPCGFQGRREKRRCLEELFRAEKEYWKKKEHRLETCWEPEEEVFVGREKYLEQIAEIFRGGKGPAVLYGIGGIGKTAIARAYGFRRRDEYDAMLFLTCSGDFQMLFGDDERVPVTNLRYSQDKYGNKGRYAREKLRILAGIGEKQRLLLILDDCNMEKDRYMEQVFSLPCHILVTTRRDPKGWGRCSAVRVEELERREWETFVRAYWGGEPGEKEWEEFSRYWGQVGGHTLLMMLKVRSAGAGSAEPEETDTVAEKLFGAFLLKKQEKQILRELSIMPLQGIRESLYRRVSGADERALRHLEDCLLVSRRAAEEGQDYVLSLHPAIAEAAGKAFAPTPSNCRRMLRGFCEIARDARNCTCLENQQIEPYVCAIFQAFPKPEAWLAREFDVLYAWLWIQRYFKEEKGDFSCQKRWIGTIREKWSRARSGEKAVKDHLIDREGRES